MCWKASYIKNALPSLYPTCHVAARYFDHNKTIWIYMHFALLLHLSVYLLFCVLFEEWEKRSFILSFLKKNFLMVLYWFSTQCNKLPQIYWLNTTHISYLTVSVCQDLGMGSLRLLQGCNQVSARAVFSLGNSAREGFAFLLPWLLIAFHSLLLEDWWKLASSKLTEEREGL